MKIGILGGTFDPIHIGHLILGEHAWQQFGLDKVLYMPAGNPPHKRSREGRATDDQRFEMVKRAIAGNPHFEITDIEMNQEGYSYSYLTLEKFRKLQPDDEFYFIIGADSLFDFSTWREPARIAAACTLLVAVRNHATDDEFEAKIAEVTKQYGAKILRLQNENIDVSSNMLRAYRAEGRSIRYYVPDAVCDYITEQNIYV